MRQYFYLVCRSLDEETQPLKCFLQKSEAIGYGQKLVDKEDDDNINYHLYRQEITRTGRFKYVKTFSKHKSQISKTNSIEQFDWSDVSIIQRVYK